MYSPRLMRLFTEHCDQVRGVAFSPSGREVVSCSADGTARFYSIMPHLSTRNERVLRHPDEILYDVAWSPDGQSFALASSAQAVWVGNTAQEQEVRLGGHQGQTLCLAYSPTGHRLAWGAQDGCVYLWDLQGHRLIRVLEHEDTVRGLAFSPDSRILATASQSGLVSFFETGSGEPLDPAIQEEFWVTCVAFSS